MNILIPDTWLRDYLETEATPKEIAEKLSLCGPSVEKVEKKGNDFVYDIEVTTNRPDCLSILGIAREAAAILPRFGIKARLKKLPTSPDSLNRGSPSFASGLPISKKPLPLEVEIQNYSLCPRFTTIILDSVRVKPSPQKIAQRLELAKIRSLNNVVDISNYLMTELGQPIHTFDYDKIKGHKMIMRESKTGESITTLDGVKRKLPKGAIIIEDGEGRIIDLCGIMGAENSAVDKNTKRVLFFVQTYDWLRIRKTSQALSFRTEASARFEKNLDPELVLPTLSQGIEMMKELAGAKVAGELIDIYPGHYKTKKISLNPNFLNKRIGVNIAKKEVVNILNSLGFSLLTSHFSLLTFSVPSWRANDISIPEDLIEEAARIYGYFNLPSSLPTGEIPQIPKNSTFYWENIVKDCLKHWGFTETYTYSMISKGDLLKLNIDPKSCLKIQNPLTRDLEYMRPSLIPSVLKVISENQKNFEKIKIFELSKVYLRNRELPLERPMLTGAITGENKFYEAKGVVEALLEEMGIKEARFLPISNFRSVAKALERRRQFPISNSWHLTRSAKIEARSKKLEARTIGIVGEIHPQVLTKFGIEQRVIVFDLDFDKLVKLATTKKAYQPTLKYPPIIEDLSIKVDPKVLTGDLIRAIEKTSEFITKVELIDVYKDSRTFRINYQDPKKTLSEKEVKKIRSKIKEDLKRKFNYSSPTH